MTAVNSPKTLATILEESLGNKCDVIELQAHANLVKGNVVAVAMATGITEAPDANDRLLFPAVALHAVSSGARGRFAIKGFCQVLSGSAINPGELVDVSADMKVDKLGTQTDGNGFARVLETASGDAELVWANIL